MSTFWPGFSVCSVKQKHSILLKYWPAMSGETLNTACAGDGPVAEVFGAVQDLGPRARRDLDHPLHRLEPPRQAGADIGIEPDPDLARDRARRASARRVVPPNPVTSQNKR